MDHPPLYVHLPPEALLPVPPFSEPFRAVVAAEVTVSAKWMSAVSEWLMRSGCMYAMAWGPQGTNWDTAIDEANLEKNNFGEIPEDKFVMTTWHDNESLEEVFWFCKNISYHSTVALHRTLLLHISAVPTEYAFLQRYDAA
jgi:hypothetical protein